MIMMKGLLPVSMIIIERNAIIIMVCPCRGIIYSDALQGTDDFCFWDEAQVSS